MILLAHRQDYVAWAWVCSTVVVVVVVTVADGSLRPRPYGDAHGSGTLCWQRS